MRHDEIFERLEPPRGGLVGLRDRLDARPSNVRRFVFAAAVVAAAVSAFVAWPRTPDLVTRARALGGVDQVALGLSSPSPSIVVADAKTSATAKVKTTNPDVVFVWISTTQ